MREGNVEHGGQNDMKNSLRQPLQELARTSAFTLSEKGSTAWLFAGKDHDLTQAFGALSVIYIGE